MTGCTILFELLVTVFLYSLSRVSNQSGVSLLYIMLEIHHSGREPSLLGEFCFHAALCL